ncbi:hypothetical protein [Streptomyces sp. NPDC101132]
MTKGALTGLLLLVLAVVALPLAAARTADRAPEGPGCRTVAYMSVVGVGAECP